jgi:uncharacterized protein (TIGR04255 family)
MVKLPKKITPCPIIDAVVEFRFNSKLNQNAVFGIAYQALTSDYPRVKELPILQIPSNIRSSDPNWIFQPHYQLTKGINSFVVQIGPNVVSLTKPGEYPGWNAFLLELQNVLKKLQNANLINSFIRVGIRCVDFFDSDIYDNIHLSISLKGTPIEAKQTNLTSIIPHGNYLSRLVIVNNTNVQVNGNLRFGSVIDTDTYYDKDFQFDNAIQFAEDCHLIQKQLFFSLLKEDFLQHFNPEY